MDDKSLSTSITTPATIIRAARRAREQNQTQFGAELGVVKQYVSVWESGTVTPGRQRLMAWLSDRRDWVRAMAAQIIESQVDADRRTLAHAAQQEPSA